VSSTTPPNNGLRDLRDDLLGQTRAAQQEANRASHEATVTSRILKKLRPNVSLPALRQELGDLQLSLETIHVAVPGFPVRLIAEHVPLLHTASIADLFKPVTTQRIFWHYLQQLERRGWDDRDRCCGLVSNWPDVGAVVLHNWPRSEEYLDRNHGYTRIVWTHSKRASPAVYSLEPLESLLEAIYVEGVCRQ